MTIQEFGQWLKLGKVSVVGKVSVRRHPLCNGGYDRNHYYWGSGMPLWLVTWEDGEYTHTDHIRSRSRYAAMCLVRAYLPGCQFMRGNW